MQCILLTLLGWTLGLTSIQGAEVISAAVDHHNGRFIMHSEVLIQLPAPQVRAILTDFENLPRVNRGLKEVHILEGHNTDQVRMKAVSSVCILVICINFNWIQEVYALPSEDIVAIIDPEQSDFREGRARWRLLSEGGHTRLLFDAELVPDFWFPPILGPWFIRRKFNNEALKTALGIERVAAQQ